MEYWLRWPSQDSTAATRADVVRWWEARRLAFNLYLAAVGVASWLLVMIAGSAAVKTGVDFVEPFVLVFGPFTYAVLANVCYTFGWLVDAVAYRGTPRIRLYKAGVVFSVLLTAVPGIGAVVAWLMTVITGCKLD